MQTIKRKEYTSYFRLMVLLLIVMLGVNTADAQDKLKIHGKVCDANDGRRPIDLATVSLPDFNLVTTTTSDGSYVLPQVPRGRVRMVVRYLGKLEIDTLVQVSADTRVDFLMQDEDFRLQEVLVTAKSGVSGKTTSSNISRNAMDHMQATSLFDLLALLPGVIVSNQNMNSSREINIRQIQGGAGSSMNSLGAAVIQDGAPISNNANLSAFNPTLSGRSGAMVSGASPNAGIDVRSISTENIESVEILRGIPSVEYGDLTSGAVIVRTKAGREPLRIKVKANPHVYQASVGTGFELGERIGALNLSGDYAYNLNNPVSSYNHYQRATAKALYSKSLFGNRLFSNTSLSVMYGRDDRELNPDDQEDRRESQGRDLGFTLNTNGLWTIDRGWLRDIRYVVSGAYTSKQSYFQEAHSVANAPYSATYVDGAVLSNVSGEHLFDADGKEITKLDGVEKGVYAHYLPNSYVGRYDIDSRELNFFAKFKANFFKNFGAINNGFMLGLDFRTDGNVGRGKMFDIANPPYRNLQEHDSNFRPRAYNDIPFIRTLGLFFEDNFNWTINQRRLSVQAGVRYDRTSVAGGVFSPRVNVSLDILPSVLVLRGGYGVTAKMPTLFYLYPERAYFEYINLNELNDESRPEAERKFITTTRIFDAQNPNLKIAENHKAEIGFDLHLDKLDMSVTAFSERLKNGYGMSKTLDTFRPVVYNEYKRNDVGALVLDKSYPILSSYYTPVNTSSVHTRGIEFDINVPRVEVIRTSFQLNGAFMHSDIFNENLTFYDNSRTAPATRKDIAIYDAKKFVAHDQQAVTTLRAIHNIPSLGFVISVSMQTVWRQSDWTTYHNDSIPVGFISLKDGKPTYFAPGQYTSPQQLKDAGLEYLLSNPNHSNAVKETIRPYSSFNINVTKEIGELMRVSFFANNMFRSYPRRESRRNPGTYYTLNNRFYFGVELSIKI